MSERIVDFQLGDGEAHHAAAPRSFFIPSRSERESLRPGDLAKLLFDIVHPQPGEPRAERMWVEVLGVEGGRYVGELTNTPTAITTLTVGDRVDFGPEHVVSTTEHWPLLEKQAIVNRRSRDQDVRPSYVYRDDPDTDADSGWCALMGDETDAEMEDAANFTVLTLGYLVDLWPELRAVFETDPANAEWGWDEARGSYQRLPPPD